jgi:hypothetical protein
VRTSWRTVPSGSVALITMVLLPSRSLTGAATATERLGGRSTSLNTSAPFKRTLTLATPLPELISAATRLD